MKDRIKKYVLANCIVLIIGLVYAKVFQSLGFGIPCVFNLATGYYCPGCGVSRMCINIIEFDFYSAFRNNPFVFIILPYIIYIYVLESIKYITKKPVKNARIVNIIGFIIIILAIIFGILRNFEAFSYLQPIGL